MGWVQKGIDSHCKCPHCAYVCGACLGTDSVLDREALIRHAASIAAMEAFDCNGEDDKT